MVNLAIIDTGLNDVKAENTTQTAFRIFANKIIELPHFPGHEEHCDIIYKILEHESENMHRSPSDVHTHIINILDVRLGSRFALLDKALRYILQRDIQLVHMSLSYIRPDMTEYFTRMLNALCQKKCFVICAATSHISFPSVLDQAISVTDTITNAIVQRQNRAFDFVIDVDGPGYDFIPKSEPSYAAPFVTAKAVDILCNHRIESIAGLKESLGMYFVHPPIESQATAR